LDINATQRDLEILTRHLGLDQPLPVQYGIYVKNIALGDFGKSVLTRRPVAEHIWERLPATVELGFVAMFLSVLIGVPIGVYSAVHRGQSLDSGARVFAVLGQSMPPFWLGLMLILFFGVVLGVLPAGGRGGPQHLILPAFTLGYFTSAAIMRLTRSSMLEVIRQDYIVTARAKGLSEVKILYQHALKNAAIPAFTVLMLQIPHKFGGSLIIEQVFAWPGIGRLFWEHAVRHDYPVVMAILLLVSVLVILFNLITDLVYVYLDPRIRYT